MQKCHNFGKCSYFKRLGTSNETSLDRRHCSNFSHTTELDQSVCTVECEPCKFGQGCSRNKRFLKGDITCATYEADRNHCSQYSHGTSIASDGYVPATGINSSKLHTSVPAVPMTTNQSLSKAVSFAEHCVPEPRVQVQQPKFVPPPPPSKCAAVQQKQVSEPRVQVQQPKFVPPPPPSKCAVVQQKQEPEPRAQVQQKFVPPLPSSKCAAVVYNQQEAGFDSSEFDAEQDEITAYLFDECMSCAQSCEDFDFEEDESLGEDFDFEKDECMRMMNDENRLYSIGIFAKEHNHPHAWHPESRNCTVCYGYKNKEDPTNGQKHCLVCHRKPIPVGFKRVCPPPAWM